MQTFNFKKWTIQVSDDVDGHLTLTVDHVGNSMVKDIGEDVAVNEDQFGTRLTTDVIEMREKVRNMQIELGEKDDEEAMKSDDYHTIFDRLKELEKIKNK